MSPAAEQAVERLASLTGLLDRARDHVHTDAATLSQLLDEADGALQTIGEILSRSEAERDRDAIRTALERTQESYASLTGAMHQEASRIARELSLLSAGAGATAHYGAAAAASPVGIRPRLRQTG